jgi:glutamate synthase (NADPH/NADH) small chain
MDCVRTAVRQKANSVKCLYRRDKDNMPGSSREVNNAQEEGVEFVWLTSPRSFIGNKKIEKVQVDRIRLGEPDASGRKRPEIQKGNDFEIPADIVIKSLGFDPENIPKLFDADELAVSRWGTIKIDLETMQTNIDGVFAAGDIVRGASLVVWAIRDGRDAAIQINKYLEEKRKKIAKEKAA